MNNKGFGTSEMVAFVLVLFFGLIVSYSLANKNLSHHIDSDQMSKLTNNVNYEKYDENNNENQYVKLEQKVLNSMKDYVKKNNIHNSTVVSVISLQENNFLNKLVNPYDINKTCNGYATYKDNSYKAFVRCEGEYATEDYNTDYE